MNYIEFIGNSWPKGHSISQLYINSRIDPQKVVKFSISIKTEDYYAED